MRASIASFFEGLKKQRVAFIGIGVTNTGIIRMFLQKGIGVTILDKRSREALGSDAEELASLGAQFRTGSGYLTNLADFDVVFRAPGVYFLSEELTRAREQGVAITSEMEVFFEYCPCRIFGITGSDGKTTTSTLISEFLKAEGRTVHLGGNIGKALLPEIESMREDDVCVVELSSFQLLSMRQSPDIAIIKNITPNHLDVHKDMEEYTGAKKNVLLHQNAFSRAILSLDNEATAALAPLVRGELSWFSMKKEPDRGTFLDDEGWLCRTTKDGPHRILHKDEILIPGMHNVDNMLTAIAAVGNEVSDETIRRVAREFPGVEHRIEFVRELDGIRYYNDSIASSPTRTIAGLNSFPQKIIVIAGGYDKKIPYEPLAPELCAHAKAVILMGATGPKIEAALRACSDFDGCGISILHAQSMEDAVVLARGAAKSGDVIALSPASASFDLYHNFEERGHHFKEIVKALH